MKKKFIWNLLLVICLNFLIKPFYILGIDAEVINRVGASVYGNYFALINFSFLLNIILDLGITNYNVKNIAQHHQLLDKHFSGIIILRLILVALYLISVLFISIIINYDLQQIKMLFFLAINQALVAFILYIRSNLSGLHLFFQDSIISVLDRFLLIVICSVLLWGGVTSEPFQIEWFIYAQSISYFITLVTSFVLVFRRTSKFNITWNPSFSLVIVKRSFPYALLILLMTLYYRIDSVMLERMIDDNCTQAGIYAQSYRFFEASNMIAYLFAALLFPIFSRMIKMKESINEIVLFAFKILLSGSFILALFCCVYSTEIITLRYNNYIIESASILSVLMICFLFISCTYIYGTLLTANGNLRHLNLIAGFGMILNIVLNLILIPKYAALGSAIASLITQFITAFIQIVLCFVIFKLDVIKAFSNLGFFMLGLLIFTFFLHNYESSFFNSLFYYLLFSIFWLFMSRVFVLSELNLILKKTG